MALNQQSKQCRLQLLRADISQALTLLHQNPHDISDLHGYREEFERIDLILNESNISLRSLKDLETKTHRLTVLLTIILVTRLTLSHLLLLLFLYTMNLGTHHILTYTYHILTYTYHILTYTRHIITYTYHSLMPSLQPSHRIDHPGDLLHNMYLIL